MADLQNEFPSWGESGEYPADGFFYEGGDQVNEKHLDALWNGVEVHVGILNEAIRDRVRDLHDNVVLDQGLVASAGSGTREVDVSASNDGGYVDGERTGSISATTTSHTANGGTSTRTDIVFVDKDGNVQKSEGTTTVPNNELKIAEVDVEPDDTISEIRNYSRDHAHHVASENAPANPEPGDIWLNTSDSLLNTRVAGSYRHVAVEQNTGLDFEFEGGITVNDDITVQSGDSIDDDSGQARITLQGIDTLLYGGDGHKILHYNDDQYLRIQATDTAPWQVYDTADNNTVLEYDAANDDFNVSVPLTLSSSATINGALDLGGALDLDGDITAKDGETIWDESNTYIPQGRLQNDNITATAGDGLKGGGSTALGSSFTFNVEPADFAGNALTDDGADNLAVASGAIQTDELDLSIGPTWTGTHQFDAGIRIQSGENIYDETGQARLSILGIDTLLYGGDGHTILDYNDDTHLRLSATNGAPFEIYDSEGGFDAVQYLTASSAPGTLNLINADLKKNDATFTSTGSASSPTGHVTDNALIIEHTGNGNDGVVFGDGTNNTVEIETVNGNIGLTGNLRLAKGQQIEDGDGQYRFWLRDPDTRIADGNGFLGHRILQGTYNQLYSDANTPIIFRDYAEGVDAIKYSASTGTGSLQISSTTLEFVTADAHLEFKNGDNGRIYWPNQDGSQRPVIGITDVGNIFAEDDDGNQTIIV
jgi:hypothetical protein